MSRTVKALERTAKKLEAALAERDKLILQATREGLSRREVARAAGLSHQRVQQIIDAASKN